MKGTKLHKIALAALALAAFGSTPVLAHDGCDGGANNSAYGNPTSWQNNAGFRNFGRHRGFDDDRFDRDYNRSAYGQNMNVNGTIFGYPSYNNTNNNNNNNNNNNYPNQNYNLISRLQNDIFRVQSRLNSSNLSAQERTRLQNRLANLTSRLAQVGQSGTVNGTLLPAISNWRTALGL